MVLLHSQITEKQINWLNLKHIFSAKI